MTSILRAGENLNFWDRLISDNGRYHLVFQADSNLVLYKEPEHQPRWATNTVASGASFVAMQPDGNLVLYTANGVAKWASNSNRSIGNYFLGMQSDGNLVIYRDNPSAERAIWASNTAEEPEPTPEPESDWCCTVWKSNSRGEEEVIFNGTIQASSRTSAFFKCNQIREENFGTGHSISGGSCSSIEENLAKTKEKLKGS